MIFKDLPELTFASDDFRVLRMISAEGNGREDQAMKFSYALKADTERGVRH